MRKMKILIVLLCLAMSLTLPACNKDVKEKVKETGNGVETEAKTEDEADGKVEAKGILKMATTTSTADTGLLDYLAPLFKEDTGWELEYVSVGTGEALTMGKKGDVDILLVHAKASEEEFVAEGYGVERVPVMYNDFVVIGPKEPIAHNDDIAATFTEIVEKELPFVNRGDDSGTDKKEKKIWAALDLDPTVNPNYVESGQGMGATITMADEQKAYCLSDRGTFLKQKADSSLKLELEIVCEKDKDLLNQYGVIAVNPEKYADSNIEGANAFIEWITSEKVQDLIEEFGVEAYGQPLFVPNAGDDA